MMEPKAFREAEITYFVPPFSSEEQIYIDCYKLERVTYQWKHLPSGKTGQHSVCLFDKNDIHRLIGHWNRTKDWEYSLTSSYQGAILWHGK